MLQPVSKKVNDNKEGILYLLDMVVDDKSVVKIGVTSRKIEDRVCEILTSHFHAYRFFCYCRPKRYRKVDNPYEKEAELLRYFSNRKYKSEKTFSGSSELVDVPLDEAVTVYERLLDGIDICNAASEQAASGEERRVGGEESGVGVEE